MPEILHRCVEQIMGQGHDEQSAYAICRASLGLAADGSEDQKHLTDSEWPILRKQIVVARPIGEFKNGPEHGELDPFVINELVINFSRTTKVPIFLWDHVKDLDESLPDGWVEGLSVNASGHLVADVMLMGAAVTLVQRFQIRSASIAWMPNAKDYQGKSIGALLQHVTLTNNPYIKDLPDISAARAKGGEPLMVCLTALPLEESAMADDSAKKMAALEEQIAALKDENTALKAVKPDEKIATLETLLQEKSKEVVELTAAKANLLEEVQAFKTSPALEAAVSKLKQQERQLRASKIRDLVKEGVAAGQFNLSKVGEPASGYAHRSDEVVLAWFKGSMFADSLDRLEFALETYEKKPLGKTFKSGTPPETGVVMLTQEEKEMVRKLGLDPEKVAARA